MNRTNSSVLEDELEHIIYSYIQNRLIPSNPSSETINNTQIYDNTNATVTTHLPTFQNNVTTPLPNSQNNVTTPLPTFQNNVTTPLPNSQNNVTTLLPNSQNNVNNRMLMINNLFNNYNTTMQTYQSNISHIINLIERIQYNSYFYEEEPQNQEQNQPTESPNNENIFQVEPNQEINNSNNNSNNNSMDNSMDISMDNINQPINNSHILSSNQLGEYIVYYYPSNITRYDEPDSLTQEQFNICVRDISYTELHNETICPITLDNFIIGETISEIRQCNHIFKKNGLMNWLSRNIKCPICRYDLRNYNRIIDNLPFTNNTYYNNTTNTTLNTDEDSDLYI